jgi:hypothetical protein
MAKSGKNPKKCPLFITKSAVEPKNELYAKFIPIFAVESFVLFSFTGDYLNLEMFKIFFLLGVY